MFYVVENTPGYLPDSEPFEFETFEEAQEYASILATDIAWEWREGDETSNVYREGRNLWRVTSDRQHKLDRVVEIIEE